VRERRDKNIAAPKIHRRHEKGLTLNLNIHFCNILHSATLESFQSKEASFTFKLTALGLVGHVVAWRSSPGYLLWVHCKRCSLEQVASICQIGCDHPSALFAPSSRHGSKKSFGKVLLYVSLRHLSIASTAATGRYSKYTGHVDCRLEEAPPAPSYVLLRLGLWLQVAGRLQRSVAGKISIFNAQQYPYLDNCISTVKGKGYIIL
jgi:hypothetical protein